MRKIIYLTSLLFIVFLFLFIKNFAYGDELDDINKQLDQLNSAYNQSKAATAPLESQLNSIKARVAFIETDLARKRQEIDNGYKNLEKQQEILNRTIRDFYIKSYYNSPLVAFLSASSASEITQLLAYQKAATDQDKIIITNIVISITDLEQKKKTLESEEVALAETKIKLDKIVTEAKAYQSTLSTQIAALSARQQEILNQRLSSLGIPLFASSMGRCSSDIGKDPGFGNAFGFFTYGVPNRVGLNQFGAFGRARAGQGYEQILRAYYNFDEIKDIDTNTQIRVDGHGTYNIEDYVKRIYEVPNEWGDQGGMEALKAQAIAARSYAMAYTNNGSGSICDSQSCQVFQDGEKGGNWGTAVEATRGKVIAQGGQPIKAWFSSTHGGYIHSSGDIGWSGTSWTKNAQDTTGNVSSFSDLKNNAYDKDSPWFYCDWGSRPEHNKTAWLKPDEVADIVNAILLARADQSVKEHLYQTDKSPNPAGTDTWDSGKVKSELQNRSISPFNSISGINVDVDWGSGKVSTVHVSGDAPEQSIAGDFFKTYFDLRAPANIQIVGPLYNVERN
jgi:SpoIID/LytB domain protein